MTGVEVAPTEGLLIDDRTLLGIKHYTVQAATTHVGKQLVGHLGAFGHNLLVQVDENAVDIDDGIFVTATSSTKEDRTSYQQ